jgi:restriction system protein
MSIPTFRDFIHPLLQNLASHAEGVRIVDAYEAVADAVGISQEERQALLPSGAQPIYKNRIGWAHDRLKRAGLSSSPRRGIWELTGQGRERAAVWRNHIPESDLDALAYPRRAAVPGSADGQAELVDAATTAASSPIERIEKAVEEVHDSVGTELLELIGRSPPSFFEKLVLDLLHRMGYGTSRADIQRVGGSGDGGIDGVISLDRLGLEKVYVQAKRWQGTVGRPVLQAFFGALAGRRAKKGVFITTSTFTREAVEFAEHVSDSMVLVDGERLAALMIEHGVGVSHKALKIALVDNDYFDEV